MIIFSRIGAIVFSALISLPISASALQVQVDGTFAGYGLQWARQAEMLIRYRPVIFEGEMHICGAYSNRGGTDITRLGRQVMREATIKMDGSTILRNLDFFNVVSSANNGVQLVGTTANCANTGLAVTSQQLSTVEIDIREGRYRVGR